MRAKAISIIALLTLGGCGPQRDLEAEAAIRNQQQFYALSTNAAAGEKAADGQDQQQLAASIKRCDQLLAAKKLKSNYERGKCMNKAFDKYAAVYPPADRAAFNTFQTDTLLIMVRLDKKEITNDEAQVLMRQSANKLVQADEATIAQGSQRQAVQKQQAYQAQVQQQQYEAARSAAMTQGFLGILQNYTQQQQQRAYAPPPAIYSPPPQYATPLPRPVTTRCDPDVISGGVNCTTR